MSFIDIAFDGLNLRARLLDEVAPRAVAAFGASLPLRSRAYQDRYSAQVMRTDARLDVDARDDHAYGYQQTGLLMLEPVSGHIFLCFGRGRLQNAIGPLAAIPLAEVGGDLGDLTTCGDRLQFEGAKPIEFRRSSDQESPLAEPTLRGRHLVITLAGVRASAILLEETSPATAAAFVAALPAEGKATNTYASGPLTRFWNRTGGKEGETPLHAPDSEATATTLYGGGYYLPAKPWRGIRLSAQEPTAMGGGRLALTPLFRFTGDWSAFRDVTATLTLDGEKPMSIELA